MDANRQYPRFDSALKGQNVAKLAQILHLTTEGIFMTRISRL